MSNKYLYHGKFFDKTDGKPFALRPNITKSNIHGSHDIILSLFYARYTLSDFFTANLNIASIPTDISTAVNTHAKSAGVSKRKLL